jgi:hypothetical protein
MFIVMWGVTQATRTIDFVVTQSDASGGTYIQMSGKSITQVTGTSDNGQAIVNVNADELSAGYRYIKGSLRVGGVTGTGANETCVLALAGETRFSDAVTSTSYGDLASVAEIVA